MKEYRIRKQVLRFALSASVCIETDGWMDESTQSLTAFGAKGEIGGGRVLYARVGDGNCRAMNADDLSTETCDRIVCAN